MGEKGTKKKHVKKKPEKELKNNKKNKTQAKAFLTPAQDDFILLISEGEKRRDAYRKAYPNCKAKDSVVDVKASQLFKMDKIRLRYEAILQDKRRSRLQRAIIIGEKAERELEAIAYGEKAYTAYTAQGEVYEKLPTIGQRIEALKELKKDSSKILEAQAQADAGVLDNNIKLEIEVIE